MANIELTDAQNVDITLGATDAAGNPVAVTFDASSVTATFADATEWTVTVSADQTSVNVKADGTLVANDVLTIAGTVGGAALAPATFTFDQTAGPASTITGTVGTPAANA